MMSSSIDMLLCFISCGGQTSTGAIGLVVLIDLANLIFLAGTKVLVVLVGAMILTEITACLVGIEAFSTLVGATALNLLMVAVFILNLIKGPVVEVPQSGQLSVCTVSRRPHFRQNGICSL